MVGREYVAQHVEDLSRALRIEVVFDPLDPLEELVQHPALARVRGDEVEDEAVLLLAVPVDAAHPLLQPHRVPRDIVVDHEPAELKVDAFSGGLRGDQNLTVFTELALGMDSRAD